MTISAFDITFHGTVQGVGFRYTARELARSYPDISGWVRNEFDGTVAMHIQGSDDEITAYLHSLTKESRVARLISRMVKSPGQLDSGIAGFCIER